MREIIEEELTGKEEDFLTGTIIGAAIEVHKTLGPGLLESVYENCLVHELRIHKLTRCATFLLQPSRLLMLGVPTQGNALGGIVNTIAAWRAAIKSRTSRKLNVEQQKEIPISYKNLFF